jgi:formate transporter
LGYLPPKEITGQVIEACDGKCRMRILPVLLLGILAGAYIGFGAELSTMVTHDLPAHIGLGLSKFVAGSVFSIGLMLVVLSGAELFTGNCLIFTGVLANRVPVARMTANLILVFGANFVGSLLMVAIMYYSGLWKMGNFGVGASALSIAVQKSTLSFSEAFARGIGCNWLVCLAVWLAIAAKDSIGKIIGIYFPIMAFVASGFEHSIANMYFIPIGLLLKGHAEVVAASGLGGKIAGLTWNSFLVGNLLPVTLGNIVGGAIFVGGVYYMAYMWSRKPDPASAA